MNLNNDKFNDNNTITNSTHKIVVIGDVNSGKTSIMKRFIEGKFSDIYYPSIGADIYVKNITFRSEQIVLQFWDCTGYEKLIPSCLSGASIIFVVFNHSSKLNLIEF